jgi:hypothetical protein
VKSVSLTHRIRWARFSCVVAVIAAATCLANVSLDYGIRAAAGTPRPRARVALLNLPAGLRNDVVLTSISCVDRTYCVAVGVSVGPGNTGGAPGFWPIDKPVIIRFNGRSWSSFTSPSVPPSGLNGVSCLSRTDCVAVGEQTNPSGDESTLVEEYTGSTWKVVPSPDAAGFPLNSNFFQGVSCRTDGTCVAVGGDYDVNAGRAQVYAPLAEVSSEKGWVVTSVDPPTTGYFKSVSCSPAKCVAVSVSFPTRIARSSVLEGNDTSWSPLGGAPSELFGASCAPDGSCTGVGQPTQASGLSVASLDGSRWKGVSLPGGPSEAETNALNSVSCADDRSCVAVGQFIGATPENSKSAFGPLVVTQTHGRWSVLRGPAISSRDEPSVASVSCPTVHECLAVGSILIDAIHGTSGGFRSLALLVKH